jgi:hypothetical protein
MPCSKLLVLTPSEKYEYISSIMPTATLIARGATLVAPPNPPRNKTIQQGHKEKSVVKKSQKGRKHKRCSFVGCTNGAKKGGVCITHGAKVTPIKRCSIEGCTNGAKKEGVCISHHGQQQNDSKNPKKARGGYATFDERIAQLEAYKAQHGHVNVTAKDNKSLRKYCTKLRTSRRYPGKHSYSLKLTKEQIATLDSMGFDWEGQGKKGKKEMTFDDRIVQLKAYKELNGNFNISKKNDMDLYMWCANMRSLKRGSGVGKLKPERIAALDSIGFDWNPPCGATSNGGPRGLTFEARLGLLKAFKIQHGHINVHVRDGSLYNWCNGLRSARKHPEKHILKLTSDRIAELDAIGFDWGDKARQRSKFDTSLALLKAYKAKHGHANVREKVDASLYRWCCSLRKARKHPEKHIMKLTTDHIEELDALGFDWKSKQTIVKTAAIECSQVPLIPAWPSQS